MRNCRKQIRKKIFLKTTDCSIILLMKHISVSAAVIFRTDDDGTKRVFATQRGYGEWKDWWEFPGGKIEAGESAQAALEREIREELATEIKVGEKLCTVEYDYPAFHLSMQCFYCTVVSGSLTLLEHENARWLCAQDLRSVKWLPADEAVLSEVERILK